MSVASSSTAFMAAGVVVGFDAVLLAVPSAVEAFDVAVAVAAVVADDVVVVVVVVVVDVVDVSFVFTTATIGFLVDSIGTSTNPNHIRYEILNHELRNERRSSDTTTHDASYKPVGNRADSRSSTKYSTPSWSIVRALGGSSAGARGSMTTRTRKRRCRNDQSVISQCYRQ